MKESKEGKLFDSLSDVDEQLINEAKTTPIKKRKKNKKYSIIKKTLAIAACVAVLITAYFLLPIKDNIPLINNDANYKTAQLKLATFPKAYAYEDYDNRSKVREDNPVDENFINAVNNFSYKTSSQILSSSDKNCTYSPISLYYALSMVTTGANGDTFSELSNLLGEKDKVNLMKLCSNLYNQLYFDNEIGSLKIANSVWYDKNLQIRDSFINNCADSFFADSFKVDFSDSKSNQKMEKWISDNTKSTLNPKFDSQTNQILSLINTVYFKDQWSAEFDKENTKEDKFIKSDNSELDCDFMNNELTGTFAKGDNFTRASLNFENNGEMVFILPSEGVSLKNLLNTPNKMSKIFEGGDEKSGLIDWKIPKFTFDTKLDLKEMLKKQGVNDAFSVNADFSSITPNSAFISSVNQESHIAVDEEGVEASAYTKIDLKASCMLTEDKAEMILNRPFIYGIKQNGTWLFLGECYNPCE